MPIMEVKHPSGRRAQIKFDAQPPDAERIRGLFASAPAASTAVAQGEPVSPEVDREIMAGRPMIQERTPQQVRQKMVDASPMLQAGNIALSGLKTGVESVKRGVPKIARGIGQLLEKPELPGAWKEAMDRGDFDAARREVPLPFSLGTLANPAASPEMTDAGEIVPPKAPDKFVKGALNVGAGAAELAVGGAMAGTVPGQLFAAGTTAVNELPRLRTGGGLQDLVNPMLAPASTLGIAQAAGAKDPENVENINQILDLTAAGGYIKGAHEGFKKAETPVRTASTGHLASRIIPADPMEAVRAIRDLTKRIGFMGDKNSVHELNKVFDTNVTHDGQFREGVQQYTVHDPSIPPQGATFFVDTRKGETLGDAFVKRVEKFAGAQADQVVAGGTPGKPGPMTPRSQDVNANRLQSSMTGGIEKKLMKLIHFSPGELDVVDPRFQGTGKRSEELRQGVPAVKNSNFYDAKPYEPFTRGLKQHEVEGEFGILDLASEEGQALAQKARGDLSTLNGLIKRAGYDGYKNTESGMPNVVRMLRPQKVTKGPGLRSSTGAEETLRGITSWLRRNELIAGGAKHMVDRDAVVEHIDANRGGFTLFSDGTPAKDGHSVALGADKQIQLPADAPKAEVQGAISKIMDENSEAYAEHPDLGVGGWTDNGILYVEPVKITKTRPEAAYVGRATDQKSTADLARIAADDFGDETFDQLGGTDSAERVLRDLPGDLGQRMRVLKSRYEKPMFGQKFGEQENQLGTVKATMDYAEKELGMAPIKAGNHDLAQIRFEAAMEPSLQQAFSEFKEHETKAGKTREKWYDGTRQATEALSEYMPELKDQNIAKLFRWTMNIFANGDSPSNELVNGIGAWQRIAKTGKIKLNEAKDEHIGNVRSAGWSAQLAELDNLVKLKGVKGAVKWLETKHPVSELNAVKNAIKVPTKLRKGQKPGPPAEAHIASEYGLKQPIEGGYIFGPKMGAYGLNKEGVLGPVTMDSWMNIAYRITQGILKTDKETNPETGAVTETPHKGNTIGERRAMSEAIRSLAKKYNTTPEDIQAIIWTHVIRPHFEAHGQTMKGGSGHHGEFAQKLKTSEWLDRRLRGKGATLEEGARIARQGGVSGSPEPGAGPDGPKPEDPF